MPLKHPLEEVSDEIALWLDEMSQDVAAALIDRGRGPFTRRLKPAEAFSFYDEQFFLPDGSPNVQGRAREMDRLGAADFAKNMRMVVRIRTEGLQSVLSEFAPEEGVTPAVEGVGGQQGLPGGY